jgi:hypothetical protein
LKQFVAELSLENLVLSYVEKAALVALVRSSPLPRRQVLAQLGPVKSTSHRTYAATAKLTVEHLPAA